MTPEGTTDPFDLEALRVDAEDATVERVVLTVRVRRPRKQEFFRVHPADDYTLDSMVYEREDGIDREVYLVAPALRAELVDVCRRVRLYVCMSKRGVMFLWPARLPDTDGAGRPWHASALEIAEEAKKVGYGCTATATSAPMSCFAPAATSANRPGRRRRSRS